MQASTVVPHGRTVSLLNVEVCLVFTLTHGMRRNPASPPRFFRFFVPLSASRAPRRNFSLPLVFIFDGTKRFLRDQTDSVG